MGRSAAEFEWGSSKPLFHGTLQKFNPGDVIAPGGLHNLAFASPDRKYSTNLATGDAGYKHLLGDATATPRIYEVAPIGKVSSFTHPLDHNGSRNLPPHIVSDRGFTVVRDVTGDTREYFGNDVSEITAMGVEGTRKAGYGVDPDLKESIRLRGGSRRPQLVEPDELVSVLHSTASINGKNFHRFDVQHPTLGTIGRLEITPDIKGEANGSHYSHFSATSEPNLRHIAVHAAADEARGMGMRPDSSALEAITDNLSSGSASWSTPTKL